MTYKDTIEQLKSSISYSLVDFDSERTRGRPPTQAFSEFLTNREQGDWAETLILQAINETSKNYKAVKYGRSDNLVAGEDGFKEFYESYQDELDEIGKRPDILVYKISDYDNSWREDISKLDRQQLDQIVPNAIAGLEIRSSSFITKKYAQEMEQIQDNLKQEVIKAKDSILERYQACFVTKANKEWIRILKCIDKDSLKNQLKKISDTRVPSWSSKSQSKSTSDNNEAKKLLQNIKSAVKQLQKSNSLSITPKVEDIKLVYKWIKKYNVPHYYIQVFFDKVYGSSFKEILTMLGDSKREQNDYTIEKYPKNQNKATIYINTDISAELGNISIQNIDDLHKSEKKELNKGRLLFYVTLKGGKLNLDKNAFSRLLELKDF